MGNFKEKYYNQDWLWARDFAVLLGEKERVEEIKAKIPSDVRSILDVGCGNGFFVNSLIEEKYKKLVGLDSSKEALKHVKTEKILGSITNLPFEDKSFDLLTCLEVLEHLPQEDFRKGVSELQRVSKKYIIITVPNEDDLEHSLVMCPKCYCWFNPYFHMRSFNKQRLTNLFNDFKLSQLNEIGPVSKRYSYPSLLFTFYRNWKKPLPPTTAVCPQCGYQRKERSDSKLCKKSSNSRINFQKLIFSPFKILAKMVWGSKEKKRWLFALYQRK